MIEDQYVVIFGQRQMILEGERAMRIRCLRIHSPNLYNLLIYIGNIAKYGGERGIRTLDTLLTYTPLAGARLQPLGHFSVCWSSILTFMLF
jgi:hypothetical protein